MLLQNSGRSSHTTAWMTTVVEKQNSAVLVTRCDGKVLSRFSMAPRRHGLEAWRVLKEEHEGTGGNRTAALLRGIFNPRVRLEKMKNEGRDFGEMHAPWEKDVAQCRVAAGADLRQAVQMTTMMQYAAAPPL